MKRSTKCPHQWGNEASQLRFFMCNNRRSSWHLVFLYSSLIITTQPVPSYSWQLDRYGSSSSFSSRRRFLAGVISGGTSFLAVATCPQHAETAAAAAAPLPSAPSSPASSLAVALIDMIPSMSCGAPATNATLPLELVQKIESSAANLELGDIDTTKKNIQNNAISPLLEGNWRLVYSNAPEITSLASKLPLGLCLGPTYQPIDTNLGYFENLSPLLVFGGALAKLQIRVVGKVKVAEIGSLNSIGVVNNENNRVNVNFDAIVFELQEVLGRRRRNADDSGGFFQKVLIPQNQGKGTALPVNDITYLDHTTRIVRGGDGSIFIFVREQLEESVVRTMLPVKERELLLRNSLENISETATGGSNGGGRKSSEVVDVGIGVVEKSKSPELQFLFQQRK